MGDDRYPRNTNPQADYYGRRESGDYGRDYGSGRDDSYSRARSYQAAGELGNEDRDDRHRDWGGRNYGNDRYGQRERASGGGDYGQGGFGQRGLGQGNRGSFQDRGNEYRGSYASDGRRFEDVGRYRDQDDDDRRGGGYDRNRNYGRQPQGYDYEERGFLARAGDEVRSWFGDDDAERRRDYDERMDEQRDGQRGDHHPDNDYHAWRRSQTDQFDRDYAEYRNENRDRFKSEFATWRTARQGQRDSLGKVEEHMDVVGSDGAHVGTVDKVRGDRIVLTKSDADAEGRHHSIPSRWIQTVDTKVTLSKTAQEAKDHWRDEERNQAMFGNEQYREQNRDQNRDENRSDNNRPESDRPGTNLNRSFSGTY